MSLLLQYCYYTYVPEGSKSSSIMNFSQIQSNFDEIFTIFILWILLCLFI